MNKIYQASTMHGAILIFLSQQILGPTDSEQSIHLDGEE